MSESVAYRADLHAHSRCSGNPTNAGTRALRSRESYRDPLAVDTAAKARGMHVVTITDHTTPEGPPAIAQVPDTFPGCEFETWSPEDDVRGHVVALGSDETTFVPPDRARVSIYDLTACPWEAHAPHDAAHPSFDMTGGLTCHHGEKLLLLLMTLRGLDGSRVERGNGLLREIVARLTAEKRADMAERHGIEAWGETPWRQTLTGGSDDHSGPSVAGAGVHSLEVPYFIAWWVQTPDRGVRREPRRYFLGEDAPSGKLAVFVNGDESDASLPRPLNNLGGEHLEAEAQVVRVTPAQPAATTPRSTSGQRPLPVKGAAGRWEYVS